MAKLLYLFGAAGAAVATGGVAWFADQASKEEPVAVREWEGDTQPADLIKFCIPALGDETRECVTRKVLLADAEHKMLEQISSGDSREMSVSMGHPTDFKKPTEKVTTCHQFARLKRAGWGGVSSVDMADEAHFDARCGIVELAKRAELPEDSGFLTGQLTREHLEALDTADWPNIGEDENKDAVLVTRQGDGVWLSEYGVMFAVLSEIAHADFNKDGHGDLLVFLLASPVDGTAQISYYALIESYDDQTSMTRLQPFKP
jgi:hypothetical protein